MFKVNILSANSFSSGANDSSTRNSLGADHSTGRKDLHFHLVCGKRCTHTFNTNVNPPCPTRQGSVTWDGATTDDSVNGPSNRRWRHVGFGIEGGTFLGYANQLANLCLGIGPITGTQELGQGHGRQQTDNGHHNHQLHEGETLLNQALALSQLLEELELGCGVHGVQMQHVCRKC